MIGRDEVKARDEIRRLIDLATQGLGEVQSVAYDTTGGLSIRTEVATAREVLASAGVNLRVSEPTQPLPDAVDAVLATVLREAVTNLLRHSAASQCLVQLTVGGGSIRLRVANDGSARSEPNPYGGAGVGNLRARVDALGGSLTAGPVADGWFELVVRIPEPRPL